ncbi:hypothetical protein ABKN59_000344 [Abortiporus biennis]
MPRILPRLIEALKYAALQPKVIQKRPERPINTRQPLSKPPPPNFSPDGREHSVLLDDFNPIIHRKEYQRHKAAAPTLPQHNGKRRKNRYTGDTEREVMSEEERRWQSSPYLRILSSSMRQCLLSKNLYPKDTLIRCAGLKVTGPRGSHPSVYFMPDGIEHPRFKHPKRGHGNYVVCSKAAFMTLKERGFYKRFAPHISQRIVEHIEHLLRVRVLQELQLLSERLPHAVSMNKATAHPIIRRLTREEFQTFRQTNVIPYENAVALLIVPPVNRNPVTKEKVQPHTSSLPTPAEDLSPPNKPLPPLSVLHATKTPSDNDLDTLDPPMIPAKIPLYNGVALFPSRFQRAALHKALNKLLTVERVARFRELRELKSTSTQPSAGETGHSKASHAYLIFSDENTILRADTVPLAISLWRLRMWEDSAYTGDEGTRGSWFIPAPPVVLPS